MDGFQEREKECVFTNSCGEGHVVEPLQNRIHALITPCIRVRNPTAGEDDGGPQAERGEGNDFHGDRRLRCVIPARRAANGRATEKGGSNDGKQQEYHFQLKCRILQFTRGFANGEDGASGKKNGKGRPNRTYEAVQVSRNGLTLIDKANDPEVHHQRRTENECNGENVNRLSSGNAPRG